MKDKLKESGLALSGGQQQRSLYRASGDPADLILMDEPASALDPVATQRIEELMIELKENTQLSLSRIICSKLAVIGQYSFYVVRQGKY